MDALPGTYSSAVIVDQMPLVHTRQLLPLDPNGILIGEGQADQQIEQVLNNLETVLKDAESGFDQLIRVNVYALSSEIITSFHQQLLKRLDASVRPAITAVQTPLPYRGALIAVDAVAGASERGAEVALQRCQAVAGNDQCADAAVLPPGSIAYLSGHPEGFELTQLPATKSMTRLMKTLGELKLQPRDVVQVKVFLNPVTDAEAVLREVQSFFPDQLVPPVVFVEWLAALPVEIEMIAQSAGKRRGCGAGGVLRPARISAQQHVQPSGLDARRPTDLYRRDLRPKTQPRSTPSGSAVRATGRDPPEDRQ